MARVLRGSETPRIWTKPLRELTPETSAGYSVIALATLLGIWLYPWQRWLLIHLLELVDIGPGKQRFRFRTAVIIVGRQNGKSTVAMVLMLWFIYVKEFPLALGTSLDLESAESVWQSAVDLAEEHPDLADEIDKIVQTNGKKSLVLASKAEYRVKSPRGGRGKAAEAVLIDELLMHKDWSGWAALTKTTLSKDEAIVVCFSTAGYADSVVLSHLRKLAHLALGDPDGAYAAEKSAIDSLDVDDFADGEQAPELEPDDHAIFEWSATPGSRRFDRSSWAQACPSMNIERPDGTMALPERNIASDARKVDPTFPTEVQGIWGTGLKEGPFPDGKWADGTDPESSIEDSSPISYCVDVSWDRSMAYIAVCGARADGVPHFEVAAMRAGTEWVEGWFTKVAERDATADDPLQVVIQARGAPASSLIEPLQTIKNLEVVEWGGADLGIACGQIFDLVKASGMVQPEPGEEGDPYRAGVAHLPQPALDVAAGTASVKPTGDAWIWNRANSLYDAAPLVAVNGALWHHLQRPPPPDESAYEDDDYDVMFV